MICISGENITDCFALNEADVGLTTFKNTSDIVKKTSDLIVGEYSLVIDCMQYGRNIFENIRKFVQY
jgi:Ca2+-transporting ATPase